MDQKEIIGKIRVTGLGGGQVGRDLVHPVGAPVFPRLELPAVGMMQTAAASPAERGYLN